MTLPYACSFPLTTARPGRTYPSTSDAFGSWWSICPWLTRGTLGREPRSDTSRSSREGPAHLQTAPVYQCHLQTAWVYVITGITAKWVVAFTGLGFFHCPCSLKHHGQQALPTPSTLHLESSETSSAWPCHEWLTQD